MTDAEHSDVDLQWAAWMAAAQAGDKASYHALLHAVTPYLRAIARRRLGSGDDAEDAVQDILMSLHQVRHTYEPGRPFKPWLATVASRRCIDLLRKRGQRLQHEVAASEDDAACIASDDNPEEGAMREQAAASLRDALTALPARQREAVRLLRLNELSLAEASAESDQSIGSLKVACHRALRSLHAAFTRQDEQR
ncbi:sigma-70 family RNA polymerase sigma factor [Lysobacter xanthus]